MSDTPQGSGWWQASDGKWYAPELHPQAPSQQGDGGQPAGEQPPREQQSTLGGQPPAGPQEPTQPYAQQPGGPPEPTQPYAQQPGGHPEPTQPYAQQPGGQPPHSGQPPYGAQPHYGGQPPYGAPAPAQGGGGSGRKGLLVALTVVGTLVVLALAGGAVFAFSVLTGDEAAADVLLEPVGDPGPDPFTDPVAPEPSGSLLDYAEHGAPEPDTDVAEADDEPGTPARQVFGYQAQPGSARGLYGGTLDAASCDPDQLIDFLAGEPAKAEAWAAVAGIDVADIPTFVGTLTPVNLGADTRVLNHGFDGSSATPRESVLQRGTAVLVDSRGVPRVSCYCGNPLAEPEITSEESFTGEAWASFEPAEVLVVDAAPTPVSDFELEDIETGSVFTRPAGSRGDLDAPTDAVEEEVVVDDPTPTPEPEPEPEEEEPELRAAAEECGVFETTVNGYPFDPTAVRVAEGSEVGCEHALWLAEEYVQFIGRQLIDGNEPSGPGDPAFTTEIQGWDCRLADPAELGGQEGGICESPGGRIELTDP